MTEPIRIDIWSDIACPWCYLGKRRLEGGLRAFRASGDETPVELVYHSYELSPDVPVDFEGSQCDFLVDRKGMPADQVQAVTDHIASLARAEGLDYDLDGVKITRTLLAHRLIHFAAGHGRQADAVEALFRAYFVDARHIGHADPLPDIPAEIGPDRDEAPAPLADDHHAAAVRADLQEARRYGIRGVPFYVFQGRYAVSGAQPAATFRQVLSAVRDELAAADAVADAP